MAEEDDLITIVDVTDPDDPSYADIKTRRRPLTDKELSVLKPMLEKVGAYKFFSMEFNFADGPAVKQFIETVELEEYKRSKQRKQVQETMKGIVAGREVIIDANLIEKTFGLVDDGENIIKPKGETNGLHAFYIKPKYVHLCQNYRGVYLKLFKSEYSYFINLTHQIQTYCCGGPAERQISLTQYRAIDLMIRGQPVNWNRYLLQNIQDKLRKYRQGPCSLYFGGTLTALIYKALHVDYSLVNKPLMISPETPERVNLSDGEASRSGKKKAPQQSKHKDNKEVVPPKKRDVSRHAGMVTRAQRNLATESPASESVETEVEPPVTRRSSAAVKALDRKRKRVKEKVQFAIKKQKDAKKKRREEIDSEPSVMENEESEEETEDDEEEDAPKGEKLKKRISNVEKRGDEIVLSTRTDRISSLLSQATGSPVEGTVALTPSKNLWSKYDRIYSLQHEYQLEHIVSKQMLEQSLQRVQELEDLLKEKDMKLMETEREVNRLRSGKQRQLTLNGEEHFNGNGDEQGPLKIRLKVGQKKGHGDEKDNGEDKGEEEEDKGVNSEEES